MESQEHWLRWLLKETCCSSYAIIGIGSWIKKNQLVTNSVSAIIHPIASWTYTDTSHRKSCNHCWTTQFRAKEQVCDCRLYYIETLDLPFKPYYRPVLIAVVHPSDHVRRPYLMYSDSNFRPVIGLFNFPELMWISGNHVSFFLSLQNIF